MPMAGKAKQRYLARSCSRNSLSASGITTSSSSASSGRPSQPRRSADRRFKGAATELPAAPFAVITPLPTSYLGSEQPIGPEVERDDHQQQNRRLRHRAGHQELEGRLQLSDDA